MTQPAFRNVLEEILDIPRGRLKDNDSRETLAAWTSLVDVQILTAITNELGLEADGDLLQAETIGDLMNTLKERNAFQS